MKRLNMWIWQKADWPFFTWRAEEVLNPLAKARFEQGKLLAKATSLGFELMQEASADILTEEAVRTAEIEGEKLNRDSVHSSVAKHLGLPTFGLPEPTRSIDGLVSVLIDATSKFDAPLTADRLKAWQAALFPTGYSGLLRIEVGKWRSSSEPMQVISGPMGRENIHFEAPPGPHVTKEMGKFLKWWHTPQQIDGLLRAGIAHFYFVTIHPFEDGNGRLARVITDMALAQDENLPMRFYSFSSQIIKERKEYYNILERSQRNGLDITDWLIWFLSCYTRAVENSTVLISNVLMKSDFWKHFSQFSINEKQRKAINLLLDKGKGKFEGGMTTRKYVSLSKVSRSTAFRDISDLLEKGILIQKPSKGRSVSYDLNWDLK